MNYKIKRSFLVASLLVLSGGVKAQITETNDDFEIGKVVATNEAGLKSNPNFIYLGLSMPLTNPADVKLGDYYWLKKGCKVVVKRSNGSFTYGLVIDYRPTKKNLWCREVVVQVDDITSKVIPVACFASPEVGDKYSINKLLSVYLGYGHKSWFLSHGKNSYGIEKYTINPDKAFLK